MKFIATITALTTAAAVTSAEFQMPPPSNFSSCASGPTQLALTSFTVSPSPMCIGEESCYTASGTLNTGIIDGARLSVTGRWLGRLVYSNSANLCDVIAAGDHKGCPIPAGPVTLKICRKMMPGHPPPYQILFQASAVNGDGGNLFCQAQTNHMVKC